MAPSPRRASPSQGKQVEQRNTKAASTYVWRFFASGVLVAAISVFYYYQYEAGRSSTPALNLAKGDPTAGDAAIFTVVDLPGKGKGAIAARDIKQGEVIIREKPLFVVPLKSRLFA
ncbi:hypothetical protein BDZ97DRAFT_565612 [Flammula alnicola]|nr:hypothetical protein BDZ97DRAFT_565612 [Flammula alnicola]